MGGIFMQPTIEELLRAGATEIDIDTVKKQGDPNEIKTLYESKGYKVLIQDDRMVFERPGKQLLKG